jgi:DNA-binding CsgD family transcriptional regulator
MSESEIKLVKELWESGNTIRQIARLLPYKEYIAIKKIQELRRNGGLSEKGGRTYENTKAKILQLYNDGIKNCEQIGKILCLSKDYVRNILVAEKLNRKRPQHNYNKRKPVDISTLCDKTQKIVQELNNGKPIKDIAKSQNVSRQYVSALKNKYLK